MDAQIRRGATHPIHDFVAGQVAALLRETLDEARSMSTEAGTGNSKQQIKDDPGGVAENAVVIRPGLEIDALPAS